MIEITSVEQFYDIVKNKTCLVDFYATWCPPCKKIFPIFRKIEEDGDVPGVEFLKVNVDDFPQIAGDAFITSLPTIVIYAGGRDGKRIIGLKTRDELLVFFKENL